jgi:hypothetical protein
MSSMRNTMTRDKRLLILTGIVSLWYALQREFICSLIHRVYDREKEENEQQEREKAASGTVWERISREIDFKSTSNTRDVSRMKQLITDLRKDSRAPGTIVDA